MGRRIGLVDLKWLQIMSAPLPRTKHARPSGMDVEAEPVLLAERVPSSADSLVSTNVADNMENEQTWPTEEEMAGALQGTGEGEVPDAKKGTTPKRIRRIPKGMTEYQASWIVDESEDEDQDEEREDRDGEGGRMDEDEEMVLDDALDMESERKSVVAFQELDMEEEQKQCVLFFPELFFRKNDNFWINPDLHHGASAPRKNKTPKIFQMKSTPHKTSLHVHGSRVSVGFDPSARVRGTHMRTCLASTHGYSSSRTSSVPRGTCGASWRIAVLRLGISCSLLSKQSLKTLLQPGTRVTIFIEGVPQVASVPSELPFVLYGLLKHEHKKTVLHFTVQRNTECEGSVRSKVHHLSVLFLLGRN